MTLSEYKKEITAIFRRNTRGGFADWRQCGDLSYDLTRFLDKSRKELVKEGRDKDLFDVACRAFVKWGTTDKDDSNGETLYVCEVICQIWDSIYVNEETQISHSEIFNWFMSKMDGTVIDYMEDVLLDYIMGHFKEPVFLVRKLDFLYARIAELTERSSEESWLSYMVERYKRNVLQIMSEQGQSIERIRSYAEDMKHPSSKELLADIEKQYGNLPECIAIYEDLAAGEQRSKWGQFEYSIKLKDIYKENGLQIKYEALLEKLLYLKTGNEEILEEYKKLTDTFDNDVYEAISLDTCVMQRKAAGGPAPESVKAQIAYVRERI